MLVCRCCIENMLKIGLRLLYTPCAVLFIHCSTYISSETSDKKGGENKKNTSNRKQKNYSTSPMIFAASLYVSSNRSHFSRSALIPSSSYNSSLNSSSL